jgi:PhnB protein
MKMQLNAYLNFDGNCREAMSLYQSVFGGELKMQTFAEAGMGQNPKTANQVIHAYLDNGSVSLFGSDVADHGPVQWGNSVNLCLFGTEETKLRDIFNKLSAGGQVEMPLAKQFWGDVFGSFTDKYGIHWMVNLGEAK